MSLKKIRYAVVGLGWIAQEAVLPAFAHTQKSSQLAALISDDPYKLRKLGKKYNVPLNAQYSYDEYEECLQSGLIDAVYIALPNDMHCEYTIKAAQAGIHVLCEKPMAINEEECQRMIQACRTYKVKLMIAYRLHFEASNLEAIHSVNKKKIGDAKIFNSTFTMPVEENNVRLDKEHGGGTLYDIGIYCINASRYLFREEPLEVTALAVKGKKSKEVDETTSAVLRFPGNRMANFVSSFGAYSTAAYEIIGTKGSLRVEDVYHHNSDSTHILNKNEKKKKKTFPKKDQFAAELIYFSKCIQRNINPEPSGQEGLIDVHIIRALYESAKRGKAVSLADISKVIRPTKKLKINRPVPQKPQLVKVEAPKG